MENNKYPIGTVISDDETPTFEVARIKLKAGEDVRPGMLVRVPTTRNGQATTLIGRIRSAYERNPNEAPESINVRDTLGLSANYPREEDSTIIYRLVEADLIEEIVSDGTRSPQTLPNSGSEVFIASESEIVQALGLASNESEGIYVGETASGSRVKIVLKREAVQRHMFICGTTGSGKSYAMGVVAEEILKFGLPIISLILKTNIPTLSRSERGLFVGRAKISTSASQL